MKVQPKSYLMKLLSLIGAALFLTPLTAQALIGPDLSVTKTCAVNGPQSVLCTVTIKNIGQVPSVAPLKLMDTPTAPPGWTYTGAGSNTGLPIGCSPGSGAVIPISCSANKVLAPNESADALFSFKGPLPFCGTFKNVATVMQGSNAATLPDPNPANNTNISTTLNLPPCGGPVVIVTPPPSGTCISNVVVSGLHYPSQTCAQSTPNFLSTLLTSFHFKSKCTAPNQLLGVTNVTCQNAPIPGFPTGSVYQGTACCGLVTPPQGKLTVKKVVNNTLGVPTPSTFSMTANCGLPSGSLALLVPPNQPGGVSNAIAAGSNCSVNEPSLPPIPDVKACHGGSASWTTSYAPSPSVMITSLNESIVTVTNTLKCDITNKPQGKLTVKKVVNNTLGVPTPSTFSMTANCTPSGPLNAPLSVPSGLGVSLATPIVAGSNCSVNEPSLPPIPDVKACHGGSASWTTNYAPTSVTIVANTVSTITVTNTLKCDQTSCPSGQTEMTFPGTHDKYCCDGKPGSDKFCCSRKK